MSSRTRTAAAGLVIATVLGTGWSGATAATTKKPVVPVASSADAKKAGIPATGKGSLKGMAQDPAATAASNNPQLTTLVAAVKAAGLVDTLNGPGPFTIFAPANSAFAKLPAGTVDTLVKPENKATLTSILTYHVVAGKKLSSKDLAKMPSLTTVNGQKLAVKVSGKNITVNGSTKVVLADVQVANGTVFIIDSVLMPAAATSAMPMATEEAAAKVGVPATGAGSLKGMAQDPAATAASNNPALTTLVAAVKAAGLVDTLNGPGPFTIFAPINSAFDKLPAGTVESLVKPENKATLTGILTYHVIGGKKLSSADLLKGGTFTTVNGGTLKITGSGSNLTINGKAMTVLADVQVANGTVHLIDSVLMP